jgi:ATP synthase protein I
MLVGLITYTVKVVVLGVVMVLFAGAGWLSGRAFALTAVAVALVWLAGELLAFTRVRTLVHDEPPAAGTVTRT